MNEIIENMITHIERNNNTSSVISRQLNGSTEKAMKVKVLWHKSRAYTPPKSQRISQSFKRPKKKKKSKPYNTPKLCKKSNKQPVLSSRERWTDLPSLTIARLSSPKRWVYPSSKLIIGKFLVDPETRTTSCKQQTITRNPR